VPPTQPFHVVMRNQQAALAKNSEFVSGLKMTRQIAKSGGKNGIAIEPFFRGVGPGAAKEFFKCVAYKGVFIMGAPGLADRLLSQTSLPEHVSANQYHIVRSVMAGVIAGSADTVFGGPLEAWATHSATAQGTHAKANYFNEVRSAKWVDKVKSAYRGAGPATVKGGVAFTTYFLTGPPIKAQIKKIFGIENMHDASWSVKLLSAVCSGGAVAFTSAPFDIAKTQAQMPNANKTSTLNSLQRNFRLFGMKGLTAGLPLKVGMVVMGWAINDIAIQHAGAQLTKANGSDDKAQKRMKM
jgi:hypothetical protein